MTEAFQPDWSPSDESEDDELPPEILQPKAEMTVLKFSIWSPSSEPPEDDLQDESPQEEILQPKPEMTELAEEKPTEESMEEEKPTEESMEEKPQKAAKVSEEAVPDWVQTDPTAAASSSSSSARPAETAGGGLQGAPHEKVPGWLSWVGTRKKVAELQQKANRNKQPQCTAKRETLPKVAVKTLQDGNVRTVR